jgi:prepilin-type N-terminal cleavage/methylation domain-containing protein
MRSLLAQRLTRRSRGKHSGGDGDVAQAGFALTEVLVCFVILLIIATAATYAVNAGINSSSITHQRVGSANVAQQQLEQARALPRASLTATPTATSTASVGGSKYTVKRSIGYLPTGSTACPTDVATDAAHEITVHVDVAPATGSTRTVGMDTVIAC